MPTHIFSAKKHILAFGGGVNSVALATELVRRGMPLDYILFSDTLSEKPQTYRYLSFFSEWLKSKGYPEIIRLPPYKKEGLYGECIRLKRLPSIAYGFKSCSEKWKIRPFNSFCKENDLFPANVYKGIDAGEEHRISDYNDKNTNVIFPLVEWGFDREDCIKIIIDTGLPLPPKSSCFFCPSMRKTEIYQLKRENPDLLEMAFCMEDNAKKNNISVNGLGRRFSWKEMLRQQRLDLETTVPACSRCHD